MHTSPFDVYCVPTVCLDSLDDTNLLLFSFEDWALLDVKLEMGRHGHRLEAGGCLSKVSNSFEFTFHCSCATTDFLQAVGPLKRYIFCPDA